QMYLSGPTGSGESTKTLPWPVVVPGQLIGSAGETVTALAPPRTTFQLGSLTATAARLPPVKAEAGRRCVCTIGPGCTEPGLIDGFFPVTIAGGKTDIGPPAVAWLGMELPAPPPPPQPAMMATAA